MKHVKLPVVVAHAQKHRRNVCYEHWGWGARAGEAGHFTGVVATVKAEREDQAEPKETGQVGGVRAPG